ncbi:hypothetical protein KR032_008175, partial [Drosophila birchii]
LRKCILLLALPAFRMDAIVRLNDYTTADYIPIEDRDIVLWESYGYLQHAANLTSYKDYADQTETLTGTF